MDADGVAFDRRMVDVHAHFVPEELVDAPGDHRAWGFDQVSVDGPTGAAVIAIRGREFLCPRPGQYRLEPRIADMDASGVAVQVLSAAPFLFYYWAEPDLAVRMASFTNEALARAVRAHPDRFLALASVPLGAPNAVDHARSAIEDLKLHGFALGSAYRDEHVDGPTFRPILRLAEELGVPIFFHPHNTGPPAGLGDYYLINLVGNPMATTISLARYLSSGLPQSLSSLRTIWAHLGGYGALALPRLQHGRRVRPELASSPHDMSQAADRIWVDALIHDVRAVHFAAEVFGRTQIVVGTDYCFDMGIDAPARHLEEIAERDRALADLIARDNAVRLFGPALDHALSGAEMDAAQ